MQSVSFGVLKVTKEKETKSPLLAHTERTAGKPQADGLKVLVGHWSWTECHLAFSPGLRMSCRLSFRSMGTGSGLCRWG